jgi:hypothetical protein
MLIGLIILAWLGGCIVTGPEDQQQRSEAANSEVSNRRPGAIWCGA